jgi:hypothetical protein
MIADNDEINVVKRRLEEARNTLHRLAPLVGAAKQVREYDSDRRKNLLAKYAMMALTNARKVRENSGLITAPLRSVASAEMEARANQSFQEEIEGLAAQREASEKTIAQWDAAFASYEAARSLLSMEKETLRI